MDACVSHSYKIHIIPSTLQKHTAGKLRGRSEIRAFPAAVWRPTAVNTFNTTYCMKKGGKEEKKIASLSLFGATFMFKAHTMSVSWVSCFYVTPWTIHFADFNLHAKWDWGFSSDADGDLISRRLNLRLQLESCRVQIFSQDFPV